MPKCYLFSNCRKSTDEEFMKHAQEAGIKDIDMLVFLNAGALFYPFVNFFEPFKNKHIIMRQCGMYGLIGFFGFNQAFDAQKHFVSINTLALDSNDVILNRGYRATKSATLIKKPFKWLEDYRVATRHDPTTGYAAYYIIRDIFGVDEKDITLVNFYGNEDNSTGKCKDHDWNYENDWLKERTRLFF